MCGEEGGGEEGEWTTGTAMKPALRSLPRRGELCPQLRQRRDHNPESSQRILKALTPPGREGRAKINTRWVGNDSAGTRPDTLGPDAHF